MPRRAGIELVITATGMEALDETGRRLKNISVRSDDAADKSERLTATQIALANVMANLAIAGIAKVADALRGVARAAERWIELSNAQEDAVNKLNASLKSTGQFTQAFSEELQTMASGFQSVTTVGDEQLLPMMGKLISVGNIQREQMQASTQAALDLSAGLGVDLNTAFLLVAKAATGNTETLARYGLTIEKTGDKQRDFETLLRKINEQFGGQAQAAADTYSGKVQQLSNAFGDFQEKLGAIVKQVLRPFVDIAFDATAQLDAFIQAHRTQALELFARGLLLVVDAVNATMRAGGALIEVYAEVRALFANLLNSAIKPLVDGLVGLLERLRELPVVGDVIAFKYNNAIDTLKSFSAGIQANKDDQENFAASVGASVSRVTQLADALRERLANGLRTASSETESVEQAARRMGNAYERAGTQGKKAGQKISEGMRQAAQAAREAAAAAAATAGARRGAFADVSTNVGDIRTGGFKIAGSDVEIGGGPAVQFEQGESLDRIFERLRAIRDATIPIGRTFVTSFIRNAASGDIGALEDIITAVTNTQGFLSNPRITAGTSIGFTAGAEMRALAATLANVLGDLRQLIQQRQFGGPVDPGTAFLVGERGPEMFIPRQSGTITQAQAAASTDPEMLELLRQMVEFQRRGMTVQLRMNERLVAEAVQESQERGMSYRA